jgi:DNA-binding MarR family transcriptional regulator
MGPVTLTHSPLIADSSGAPDSSRAAAWTRLEQIEPGAEGWDRELSALTMVLVDSLLAADTRSLEAISDPLRDRLAALFEGEGAAREMRGWLTGLLAVTRWGLQRLPSATELDLRHNTQAWSFLEALRQGASRSSSELRQVVGTGESQISRVGRDLLARGLVIQRRVGRTALWELTPRGKQLFQEIERQTTADSPAANQRTQQGRGVRRRPRRANGARDVAPRPARQDTAAAALYRGPEVSADGERRYVLPHPAGGWMVVKEPAGRPVAKAPTKKAAIDRAKQIVGNAGGGQIVPGDRDGKLQPPLAVRRSRRQLAL